MQSTKNRRLRNFEVKEGRQAFGPRIAMKIRAIKDKLFAPDDPVKVHLRQQNLANFKRDQVAKKAEMETAVRMFNFVR